MPKTTRIRRCCVWLASLAAVPLCLTVCNDAQSKNPQSEEPPIAESSEETSPSRLPATSSSQLSPGQRRFHHIALVTDKPHPGEIAYPSLKLWATSPDANRNRTEWIRFASDSPLGKTTVGKMPHVAFLVDDLDKELQGKEVVAGPVQVTKKLRVAYFMMDGLLVEYMEGEL